jgi:predicted AlkP superfamily phosphohydrolase/phosphomutase/tetratricopeptide (TPR) repeat protein
MKKRKVLLIGWDAADWKVINPLMDAGKMPALEKLVNNGIIGNLATLDPPLSPMLWTSIATGKRADKHGILGFIEPVPNVGGVRPVNVTSRKTHAIWNILGSKGLKTNVVSWWPSHPAEPVNGVMVSNFYKQATKAFGKKWPMLKGTIHPEEMTKELRKYRVHPGELTAAHILPFVPNAAKVDQEKDKRLASVAKITADAASVQAVSTYLMENTEWDFMAVYFDAIDHYGHGFMKFKAPQMPGIPDDLFELYKDVVEGGYIYHDMMLERMLKLAGEDTTVVLISDHGFHSDHLRPLALPKLPAAPAMEHRAYGIICMAGPGIKKDERIYGASLLDITPTILSLYDLPLGKDMDGKVLLNAFEDPKMPAYIDSWENEKGNFYNHSEAEKEDTYESAEALKQLVELGYIEDPGPDKNKAMERATKEAHYNLAKVHASAGNFDKSIELVEKLYSEDNKDIRYNLDLANWYLQTRQISKAEEIIENLKNLNDKYIPSVDLLEGLLNTHKNRPHKALKLFQNAEKANPRLPGLHLELGKIYLQIRKYKDAERAFSKALEIDDGNAAAWHGMSICMLRQEKYEEAAHHALTAIGLMYHFPPAHYHLGEALYHLGRYKEASQAFEVALSMMPRLNKARRWLSRIYKDNLNDEASAKIHVKILDEQMKGKVVIVSGLPRSGTSMMMQVLQAGGLNVLKDEVRKADESNPKGYYEYEKVKKLTKENDWFAEADGKVLKVIAHLLKFLPTDIDFKIIFMQRDLYEVISSQQKMLGKNDEAFPVAIANAFENEVKKVDIWQKKEPNVDLIYVNYQDVIKNPMEEIDKVNEFLDFQLDIEEAVKVVDPELYRNKKTE